MPMDNRLIYKKFLSHSKKVKIVENLYLDEEFAEYYKSISDEDIILNNDLPLYEKILKKSNNILEIGSGTGRVFNYLFLKGYNIHGLEPSKEMSDYILEEAKDRIYNLTFQEIDKLPLDDIETIIIPATSISLFSQGDFEIFLYKIMNNQTKLKNIFFDFMEENFFLEFSEKISKKKIKQEKYYSVNFFDTYNRRIIYNVMNSKKLGVSIKYIYSLEVISKLFEKLNIRLDVLQSFDNYVMVEGIFNDKR
ncbi:methyltransferase domain-containing protein [Lactococcus lactis]|uniref:methyltransferase domain-containing protein n=1 Tax=Lactococcus lactis TaxID=1358 RepID=UPI00345D23BF